MGLTCRLLGHRFRFQSEGATMRWACERDGCDAGGTKRYESAERAAKFAAAFDVEDRHELGRRAPFGLLALRLWRAWRRRDSRSGGA
jgi:hypothetical protein